MDVEGLDTVAHLQAMSGGMRNDVYAEMRIPQMTCTTSTWITAFAIEWWRESS
jgi:hypothetical protein